MKNYLNIDLKSVIPLLLIAALEIVIMDRVEGNLIIEVIQLREGILWTQCWVTCKKSN